MGKDIYHLDNDMTKQELQMENRLLRNRIRQLHAMATEWDLAAGVNQDIHVWCERVLTEINRPSDRHARAQEFLTASEERKAELIREEARAMSSDVQNFTEKEGK